MMHMEAERQLLKDYLDRRSSAVQRLPILQERAKRLRAELYDEGSPNALYHEIEARMQSQIEAARRDLLEAASIVELLPSDTTERAIMELRYIYRTPWAQIGRAVHLARTPCFKHFGKGLDQLLAMEQVRLVLGLTGGASSLMQ